MSEFAVGDRVMYLSRKKAATVRRVSVRHANAAWPAGQPIFVLDLDEATQTGLNHSIVTTTSRHLMKLDEWNAGRE